MNYKGDLVVSRFNEDISWLSQIKGFNTFIYNKGNQLERSISLPNIGREVHTYLYHIINNYDNLSDWTFFTQGHPFDHVKNYTNILNNFNSRRFNPTLRVSEGVFFLSGGVFNMTLFSKSNGNPHDPGTLNLNKIWLDLFQDDPLELYPFTAGAIFIANRDSIKLRSKKFYEKCLELSITRDRGPWEFERIFPSIFNPEFKSKI